MMDISGNFVPAPTTATSNIVLTEVLYPSTGPLDGLVGAAVASAIAIPIAAVILLVARRTRREVVAVLTICAAVIAAGGAIGAWGSSSARPASEREVIASALESSAQHPGIDVTVTDDGRVHMSYPHGASCEAEIVDVVHATKRDFGHAVLAPVKGKCEPGFPVPASTPVKN